ncbi:DUF4394 domain-containing protein [Patulibacter sp.]|uniref:DUF4394 domain-containing protein n=1 Tax=Patulibacter sp. TaxID=1912859 RepID=UPI002721EC35|nr:DUF4394 domain-containing protein [Patulibacter sp.]MDO9410937.1 DUF4394 domain-containing protein [Patulibacter sp.]
MPRPTAASLRRAALAGGILAGLAVPSAASAANSSAVVLTTDNKISTFETGFPAEAAAPVAVTGLATNDKLVGIDFRPQNGYLYGLGYAFNTTTPASSTIQLYAISVRTGLASALGDPIPVGGTPTATTSWGFDFNPTVDRVRVVSDAGYNGRLNPNDGALVDGDAGTPGVQPDPAINPTSVKVDGAAYTNNEQNATVTKLFTLSGADNTLYVQNPANAGTQTAGKPVTLSGSGVDFDAVGGFDISPGINAAADGSLPAGSAGFVATNTTAGATLSLLDLNTGAAVPVGAIGNGGTKVAGLAIQQETTVGGLPSVALTSGVGNFYRFNTADPLGGVPQSITGLSPTETPVAIDYRAQNGQLLLLAVNDVSDTGSLYRLDPQTGAATVIGTPGSVAFRTAAGATVDLPPSGYDIDVNPTVDRVRVVTTSGLNFRLNPTATGSVAVDTDPDNAAANPPTVGAAGAQPDGTQNPAGSEVGGTAYTNAFGQSLTGGVTTQYGINPAQAQLQVQNPPNAGTQTLAKKITVNGASILIDSVKGFDITPGVRVATSNAVASGTGIAILNAKALAADTAKAGIYAIDLSTGAATLKGTFPTTPTPVVPTSLALGDVPPASKDRTPPVVVTPPNTGGGGTGTNPGTTPTTPTTPATPTTPTAAARINLRKVNAKAKRKGRKFTTTGSLSFRRTYTSAEKRKFCAKGTVSIQVRAGKRTISTRRVTLKSNCTFSSSVTFSSTRRFAGRSKLSFAVKFNGTAFVLPRRASTFSVKTR